VEGNGNGEDGREGVRDKREEGEGRTKGKEWRRGRGRRKEEERRGRRK
jgi:hypothetical protein